MKPPSDSESPLGRKIESWGNERMSATAESVDSLDISANERNRTWWASLPMTYSDWESSQRTPESAEDFARVDRFYFETNPYIEQHIDFSKFDGLSVLEVGCGAGSATCRFAAVGANVTAVDLTAEAVALTTAHAVTSNVSANVHAIQCDAETLQGLADNTFDYVYSWGVMHHSSQPEACFAQAARVLKQGGKGMIMVYHKSSIRYWIRGAAWLFLKGKIFKGMTFDSVQRCYTDGYYHRHYTEEGFRQALTEAGLSVTHVAVTHMSSRMIPGIPEGLRAWLKSRWGWLLVAHFEKK